MKTDLRNLSNRVPLPVRPWLAWGLVFLVYLLLYGYRLHFPPVPYYDEIFHVPAARQFLALEARPLGFEDTAHPPIGKLLIALSILVFGDQPWAWRLPSLLASFGCICLVFLIGRRVFGSVRIGGMAAGLLMLDGIFFTQARVAMLNASCLFFALLALFRILKLEDRPEDRAAGRIRWAGLFFGLALATKWAALAFMVPIGFCALRFGGRRQPSFRWPAALHFALPALLVYFASFLIVPFIPPYDWSWIFKFQTFMLRYHLHLTETDPDGSRWWSWPLLIQPVRYFLNRQTFVLLRAHETIRAIICIGNPAVIWPLLPSAAVLAWKGVREKSWVSGFVVSAFLANWIPYAFIQRLQFLQHFYLALPFAVLGLAYFLDRLWTDGSWKRGLAILYFLLVAGLFFYWMPLWNGSSVNGAFFRHHLWLPSWNWS